MGRIILRVYQPGKWKYREATAPSSPLQEVSGEAGRTAKKTAWEKWIWLKSVTGITVMAAIIFIAAGRLDYWQGWVYVGVTVAFLALTIVALWDDKDLIAERLKPGAGTKTWDKLYFIFSTPLYLIAIIMAGMDGGRYHWSGKLPFIVYLLSTIVYCLGQALFLWSKKVNSFFSSVVRIQTERGQTVCREGPYRVIRHPGYLSGILFGLATPLMLGSYWALIPQGMAAILVLVRTALEDRTLAEELPGYTDYTEETRYRLVPYVW